MYNYSSRPIDDYLLPGLNGQCEAGAIKGQVKAQAIWNLFWLSVPSVDNLIGATQSDWFHRYKVVPNASLAVTSDVVMDEVMYRKVMMHPARFVAWFHRADHRQYDCFGVLGGNAWVDKVIERAQAASSRLAQYDPQIARFDNVVDLCMFRNARAA